MISFLQNTHELLNMVCYKKNPYFLNPQNEQIMHRSEVSCITKHNDVGDSKTVKSNHV